MKRSDLPYSGLNELLSPCGLIDHKGEVLFLNDSFTNLIGFQSNINEINLDRYINLKDETTSFLDFCKHHYAYLTENKKSINVRGTVLNARQEWVLFQLTISIYGQSLFFHVSEISANMSISDNSTIQEEEYYKQIVNLANVAIVKFDKDLIITDFTGNSEKVFEFKKEEVIGKSLEETIVPKVESTGRELDKLVSNLVDHTNVYEYNINENITKSGKRIWMQWYNSIIYNKKHEQTGVLSFGMDISNLIHTETALKESEERFKTLSDLTFEGIVIHENGLIMDCNLSFGRQIGYARKELIGKNLLDLISPAYRQEALDKFAEAESQYEAEAIHKNGNIIPISVEGQKTKIGKKEVRVAAVRNISELKKTINELDNYKNRLEDIVKERTKEINAQAKELSKKNELLEYERNQLRTIIDNIPDFIYIKDEKSRFLNVNKKQLRTLLVPDINLILGKTDFDFYEKKLAKKFYNDEQQIFKTGLPILDMEEPGFDEKGNDAYILTTKVPLKDNSGKIVGIVGIGRDITARKIAQNKLQSQAQDLKHANTKLEERAEKIEKLNGELNKYNQRLATANLILNERKEELETTLEQLKQAQSHLIQAEKMASLGVLTAGIAHEINNPVNFVYAGVNSLMKDFKDIQKGVDALNSIDLISDNTEEIIYSCDQMREEDFMLSYEAMAETLNDVKLGAKRITEIVAGLSRFSRLESENWKMANIHEELESVLILLKNKYKHHIEIVRKFDTKIPNIECFPGKLNQVFMNIINNSIDAIEDKEGKIEIITKRVKENVHIIITDTGKGISRENELRIFDPFFTTKEVGYGMGLGLAISYSIIQEHQGNITVESSHTKGTTFNIIIPILQQN